MVEDLLCLSWVALIKLLLSWFELSWVVLGCFELIWVEFSWSELIWVGLSWFELSWIGFNGFQLLWIEMIPVVRTWHSMFRIWYSMYEICYSELRTWYPNFRICYSRLLSGSPCHSLFRIWYSKYRTCYRMLRTWYSRFRICYSRLDTCYSVTSHDAMKSRPPPKIKFSIINGFITRHFITQTTRRVPPAESACEVGVLGASPQPSRRWQSRARDACSKSAEHRHDNTYENNAHEKIQPTRTNSNELMWFHGIPTRLSVGSL